MRPKNPSSPRVEKDLQRLEKKWKTKHIETTYSIRQRLHLSSSANIQQAFH